MPFTTEQFLEIFESYNRAVSPLQWVLISLALVSVLLAVRRRPYSNRLIAATLAVLWAWTGIAYHLMFFTRINSAAYIFGSLCMAQAALFLFAGLLRRKLFFRPKLDGRGITGGLLIVFALLLYPALGFLLGHAYPRSPTFGAPCPTTIFTFGLLLWTDGHVPPYVLVIPLIWSLLGFSAALILGMREDVGLLLAGIAGTLLIAFRNRALKVQGSAA